MFRNYIKIAFRHLQKNKLYACVNIAGLTIGITSCLLIGIYIWHELGFDKFHKNGDRIVRVTWEYNFGDSENKVATTGTKVGPAFQRTFPEVEAYARMLKYPRVIAYADKLFNEKNFLYADSGFFSVFSFALKKGDPSKVLDAPEKLVISESMAKKYFGNEDPVGKMVKVGGSKDFTITGIVEDAPENSQIQYDFLASFTTLNASKTEKWVEANYVTYLLLRNNVELQTLQEKVDILTADVLKKEMQGPPGSSMKYHLEPLKSVHLHSKLDGFEPNNSIIYIYILATVALMILLIAFVNYTNLSTAQSARRSTEIGMRKVMGAGKKQVFFQFISESYLITLFAILVALLLSVIMLPSFNQLSGKNLNTGLLFSPFIIVMLLVLSIIIAFSAGVYPAVILSGSKVIHVLKAGFRFTGSGALRKSLIVFQFAISLFLMIATIIILQQLEFIRNKDLGFNKNQVMVLPLDAKMTENYDGLKKALLNLPGVQSVGGAYESPVDIGWGDGLRKTTGESITVNALPVDEDFSKTLDLKIIAGNHYSWSDVLQFDTSNDGNNIRYSFILNEAAVKALGWKPEEAIGKTLTKGKDGIVKAVVKDFHFRSFHETINPLVIFLDKRLMGSLFIRIQGDTRTALDAVGATWKQRVPHRPFEYSFLDEEFDALYKTEQRTANVFTAFSSLAIFLACLGLFALTAYAMVQRTKEIGIRKVLGARVTDILSLVSKDFLKLIVISMLIAIPLALFAMNKWLEDFIYKTPIQWWVFLAAGILTWLIAFLTISIQALKTALANPVKNLRTE